MDNVPLLFREARVVVKRWMVISAPTSAELVGDLRGERARVRRVCELRREYYLAISSKVVRQIGGSSAVDFAGSRQT